MHLAQIYARSLGAMALTIASSSLAQQTPIAPASKPATADRALLNGLWAETQAECKESDAPDSKTFINLNNNNKGRRLPLFDQYEHHCVIKGIKSTGSRFEISATCYEFWDDFQKKKAGVNETISITLTAANKALINRRAFLLCKPVN